MGGLTAEIVRDVLDYCDLDGSFRWSKKIGKKVVVGGRAGVIRSDGYVVIRIHGRQYRAHSLAWLYVHGCWPAKQIDHINGVRDDNRISNLREATQSENNQNQRRARSTNKTSGFLGVSRCAKRGAYRAEICTNGKKEHLGYFEDIKSAEAAYIAAKVERHPFQTIVNQESTREHG